MTKAVYKEEQRCATHELMFEVWKNHEGEILCGYCPLCLENEDHAWDKELERFDKQIEALNQQINKMNIRDHYSDTNQSIDEKRKAKRHFITALAVLSVAAVITALICLYVFIKTDLFKTNLFVEGFQPFILFFVVLFPLVYELHRRSKRYKATLKIIELQDMKQEFLEKKINEFKHSSQI